MSEDSSDADFDDIPPGGFLLVAIAVAGVFAWTGEFSSQAALIGFGVSGLIFLVFFAKFYRVYSEQGLGEAVRWSSKPVKEG